MATDLDLIFAALADPTRRAILSALIAGDRTVGELAQPHDISLAAISKHLQVLARAGLLAQERAGRVVTCRALPDGLRAAGIWIQGVGGFDADDLDALETLVRAGLAAGGEPLPEA
jgi:DNA-binding transcriptional ArsR family regulator